MIDREPEDISYMLFISQLLEEMTEAAMLNVIMKHIHRLVAFYSAFPKLIKLMMKVIIIQ